MISKELLQAIVDYLVRKPYNEVFQLIGAIQNETRKANEPEEEPDEE